MVNDIPAWSLRSVLVSVSNLDLSSTFYQEVMNVVEVLRDGQVAVLSGDELGSMALFLRQAQRNFVHA